jgi:hypothetical protein
LIAHFGDATQFLFAAAGFVRRRQTQRHAKGVLSARRGKLSAIAELMTIPNAGVDCRRGYSTNVPLAGRACLLSTNGIKATGFQPVRFSVMYYNLPSHF